MGRPGEKRLGELRRQHYYHLTLHCHIEKLKCQDCQQHKIPGCGYGLLPKSEVYIAPCKEAAIDLIGPWEVNVNGKNVKFNALTCIDTASNLVELIMIENKTATHLHDKFTQCWLCPYPQPIHCVHDKGGKVTGSSFHLLNPEKSPIECNL